MDTPPAFSVLVCLRLLLAVLPLPGQDLLKHDHQLSSPLTSYLRLNEGIWLLDNNIDPYMGGAFHQSPLLLSLFSTIVPPLPIVWAVFDAVGAWALLRIWRSRQGLSPQQGTRSNAENLIVSVYLLNPYILLPSLALSTSTFENTLTLLALMFASEGNVSPALLAIAFTVHLTLSSILLLLPILMVLVSSPVSYLASPRPFHGSLKRMPILFGEFTLYWLVLVCAACIMAGGSWSWVRASWGASLTLPDLTPNPGLWWYFFTEMFDHFRPFFLMVFSVHLVIYVLPICIKFQHDPLYAAFLLVGVLGTFKAYLTLADPGLFISMYHAHLHVQLGTAALDATHHNEAADHFTAAVNSGAFSSKHIHLIYEDLTVLFGWDLESLCLTAHQQRCQAFLLAAKFDAALEAQRFMMDVIGESAKASCLDWSNEFKERCSTLAAQNDRILGAEIPGQEQGGYDAEPNFFHGMHQCSQNSRPRPQQPHRRLKRLRLSLTRTPPVPPTTPPPVVATATFKTHLRHLFTRSPHHAMPPVVYVSFAKGKERNAAAGAPGNNPDIVPYEDQDLDTTQSDPNTQQRQQAVVVHVDTGEHGGGKSCVCC